jgi:cell division transport system permease protein
MMMAKKEPNRSTKMLKGSSQASAKALEPKRRHRFVTFMRILRYGLASFSRNAWLSVASLAVMLVTLLIICISLVTRDVMMNTVADIRDKIDMSIYVKPDTSEKDITVIKADLEKLSTVKSVKYISPDEAKEEYARDNVHDVNTSAVLNKAKNNFQGTFNIKILDIDDTKQLEDFVKTNGTIKKAISERYKPSFATDRKAAIDNIARTVSFAEKIGLLAAALFVAIAALMIFNTIRMSIHNRREEIYMMRLIGADKGFIRGPFIVEAVVTGVIAAILATGLVYSILFMVEDKLQDYGIVAHPTVELLVSFVALVLLAMIAVGSLIGVVSSSLATRKYLKSQG